MKAAVVGGTSGVDIVETDTPVPGRGEIRVRMKACGICGSDVEKVFGRYGKPSMRLGHEPAGTITGVGDGVSGFSCGERVFTHHHVPCYACHLCRHGCETICKKYSETNLVPCGLAEEYVVPEWNVSHGGVLKLADSVSFEDAALIEPLACCIRAWSRIKYQDGDSVAIFGAGPTGMMHVMLAQEYGLDEIFCLDTNGFRLEFASGFGLAGAFDSRKPVGPEQIREKTGGRGADICIVATGNMEALKDALCTARPGGTIMIFGVPPRGTITGIDMGDVYSRELSILTSYAAAEKETRAALEIIESGRTRIRDIITHRYGLAESQAAFEHARTGLDAMKILVTGD